MIGIKLHNFFYYWSEGTRGCTSRLSTGLHLFEKYYLEEGLFLEVTPYFRDQARHLFASASNSGSITNKKENDELSLSFIGLYLASPSCAEASSPTSLTEMGNHMLPWWTRANKFQEDKDNYDTLNLLASLYTNNVTEVPRLKGSHETQSQHDVNYSSSLLYNKPLEFFLDNGNGSGASSSTSFPGENVLNITPVPVTTN